MRTTRFGVVLAAALMLGGAGLAQDGPNEQTRKDADRQVKQDAKADKAQAKADKSAHKALKSKPVKRAARDQDRADKEAAKANPPQ